MTDANAGALVSVILPALSASETLARALVALEAQSCTAAYEVIVVCPAAIDLSSFLHARHVRDAEGGSGAAMNTGVMASHGSILAFTDSACIPDAGWLEAGVNCLEKLSPTSLVAGQIVQMPVDALAVTPVEEFEMRWSLRQEDDVRRGYASASNLFVRREALDTVGLFREDLPAKADWEFCHRARGAGFHLVYCESARVEHTVTVRWLDLWRSKVRLAGAIYCLDRALGRRKSQTRLAAMRELRPPLRSLVEVWRSEAQVRRKVSLVGTLLVARVAYVAGWVLAEVRSR